MADNIATPAQAGQDWDKQRQCRIIARMPELPEVEIVRRGLAKALVGRRIVELEARRPDLRFPLPERFAERVMGAQADSVSRRGKYLIIGLSTGESLVAHLGMTGRFIVHRSGARTTPGAHVYEHGADARHDHVVLDLDDETRIVYNDARRFGYMLLIPEAERELHPLFRHLGAEPLGPNWSPQYAAARAKGKKANLKSFLMDQRIVAGVGNIYASEALHRAALDPNRTAGSLADRNGHPTERALRLAPAVRDVLKQAIGAGGSTLRDYRHADGASGQFQERFAVYDRAGAPCRRPKCGGVIKRVVHSARATYYCSRCQK